ncbi:TPA: Kae1-associated serine/threonine protein kinase [archaeon]|uniref:non-specific serine/threonine protein kinase n=1 Tax=Candidatus Naiadarchaeum limnaeum TaxID=2756139 RepID=A0A832X6I8_9ARCH|nr:Kae1-associated serine/threonine protein kinase [Candidatus Naiadarchaeum limnaeum]
MEKELKLGAEARLTLKDNIVIKERISKSYRLPQIDIPLRKDRTSKEASLLQKAARAQVNVPRVLKVDKENFSIEMEFISGELIDHVINENLAKELGREIALMHDNSIIHGDLTTSNIIVHRGKVFFIDFGLGEISDSVEKKAVDLRVLKEAIRANHPAAADKLNKIILDSYRKNSKKAAEVLSRLEDVEKRGRYKVR